MISMQLEGTQLGLRDEAHCVHHPAMARTYTHIVMEA